MIGKCVVPVSAGCTAPEPDTAGCPDFLCWYIPYLVSKSVPQEHLQKKNIFRV